MYTFKDIEHHSTIVDDNEFFTQYLSEKNYWRYDSNFFKLKFQPYLQEFKLIEEMQLVSHQQQQMNHLKFYWPMDTPLTNEITKYFDREGYLLEFLEIYTINPADFKPSSTNPNVSIKVVTEDTLGSFKSFNYPNDKQTGADFANYKLKFYERLLDDEKFKMYMAMLDNQVVGSLITIESDELIEIDDVYTHEDWRNQHVATGLQMAVMDEAIEKDKTVILVADGEDTVRSMYERQGYQREGYTIGALKLI